MRLCLAGLLCYAAFAQQSQQPSPGPLKSTQKNQKQAAPEQSKKAPERQPSPSDTIGPPQEPITKQSDAREGGQKKAPTDWWAIGNTALLTIFTGSLAWLAHRQRQAMDRQAEYMRDALAETKKAADAARDSADAANRTFVSSHRPKLNARLVEISGAVRSMSLQGTLLLVNTGETRAIVKRAYSEIIVGEVLPRNAMYLDREPEELWGAELKSRDTVLLQFPTTRPRTVSTKEFNDIGNRQQVAKHGKTPDWPMGNIFIVGWVEYCDDGGTPRRLGFCRKYNYLTQRFEIEPDPDYEYDD